MRDESWLLFLLFSLTSLCPLCFMTSVSPVFLDFIVSSLVYDSCFSCFPWLHCVLSGLWRAFLLFSLTSVCPLCFMTTFSPVFLDFSVSSLFYDERFSCFPWLHCVLSGLWRAFLLFSLTSVCPLCFMTTFSPVFLDFSVSSLFYDERFSCFPWLRCVLSVLWRAFLLFSLTSVCPLCFMTSFSPVFLDFGVSSLFYDERFSCFPWLHCVLSVLWSPLMCVMASPIINTDIHILHLRIAFPSTKLAWFFRNDFFSVQQKWKHL